MAKEKEDVDFTFDTTGFTNGLKSIASGIADVTKNTVNMAKNVSKGVINAVAKMGLLKLAFNGIRSAIKEMPEIGKTFTIAKDIIMRNFLFPVRKAIFPVLQKFLDWVRDNRGMFVKWGQTLVTVFTVVSKAVGNVIDLGKRLIASFGDFFNRTFGTNIKSFNDLLNIISFKFAVVVEFLKRMLTPIIDTMKPFIESVVANFLKIAEPVGRIAGHLIDIAASLLTANNNGNSLFSIFSSILSAVTDIAKFAAEIVESFVKGLKPNISGIVDKFQDIADLIKDIVEKIFGGTEHLKEWKEVFQWIGDFIGKAIQVPLEGIRLALEATSGLIDLWKAAGGAVEDFFGIGKPKETKVKDAIIKPSGEIIKTDPADYIIATKTPGAMGKGNVINIDFSGMNIIVQKGSQEEAVRFGESIVDIIRNRVDRELVRSGAV